MIKSFKCKETQKVFKRTFSKKLPTDIQSIALRKLRMINRAHNLNDLMVPPGNRFELLGSNRKGQYSVRINDQWRICFNFTDHDAYNVEITDYH